MRYYIEEARKKAGITQDELAVKSGVSRSIISGLESGRVEQTTIGTLRKLAAALNVELVYFFTGVA